MIKLNRIGNKFGLAGLVGVLLSGGMLINQMVSESAITVANQRAEAQQVIASHALEANVALRRMQLAARDIRLSTTPAAIEKNVGMLTEADARAAKELDITIGRAMNPQNKERLVKIKSLAVEYRQKVTELAQTQLKTFEVLKKRNDLTADWNKAFDAGLAAPALAGAANRLEIEKALHEMNSLFNGVRAATWRYASTGEENQKQMIERRTAALNDALVRARSVAGGVKELSGGLEPLASVIKGSSAATAEAIQLEAVKRDLVE